MPSQCKFEFDRSEPIFYSGETVKGSAVLTTTQEKYYKEIFIEFKGEAKTQWTVYKAFHIKKKRLHHSITYKGLENYLQNRQTIETDAQDALAPGIYEYTFDFLLPSDMPSSCEEAFGHIRYEILLVIDRKLHFSNVFRQPITVLRQFDLNEYPELLLPLTADDRIFFCGWPCKSGPIKSKLTIPFGGYASGQHIHFSLHIENRSMILPVKGIRMRLIQTYTFIAHTPRVKKRSHSVTIAETVLTQTILRSSEGTIQSFLKVPAVPPTSEGQFIVSVGYHIEMVFGAIWSSFSKIILPVIIGTVPIMQSMENVATLETPVATLNVQLKDTPCSCLITPTSYENANTIKKLFIDRDVEEHSRCVGFTPKYPMYTTLPAASSPPILSQGFSFS